MRSPQSLIKEIILVDDASERGYLFIYTLSFLVYYHELLLFIEIQLQHLLCVLCLRAVANYLSSGSA